MANAPKCPAKAASGMFCRSSGCIKPPQLNQEHLENIISGTRHKLLTALAQHPSHILKIFLHKIKKTAFRSAVFLGEGILLWG